MTPLTTAPPDASAAVATRSSTIASATTPSSATIVSANTPAPATDVPPLPLHDLPAASSRRPGASGSAAQRPQDHRDRRRARRLPSPQGPTDSDHRAGQAVRDRQAPMGLPQARREGRPHRPASSEAVRRGRRLRLPRPQLPPNPHNRRRSQGRRPPRTRPLPPPRPRSPQKARRQCAAGTRRSEASGSATASAPGQPA